MREKGWEERGPKAHSKTLILVPLPKGPSRTKNTTESEFSARGAKFGTGIAKRYGEVSEMLVFL